MSGFGDGPVTGPMDPTISLRSYAWLGSAEERERSRREQVDLRRYPTHIAGFEILGALGGGATGDVLLATGRTGKVALKLLTKIDERTLQRFHKEAEVMRRLSHPNIVEGTS